MRDIFLRFEIRRFWYACLCLCGAVFVGIAGVIYLLVWFRSDHSVVHAFQPWLYTMGTFGMAIGFIGGLARLMVKQQERIEILEEDVKRLRSELSSGLRSNGNG